ncbi:AAA domain-containing protein [Rhodococcus jostii]|uniref:Part of AAA domain-containing protein n=1 Tax=Rhodococcus jostii TaxID=132919 RepID=A0A1H5FCV7_RHOJO|nr:AAA domain-containing protein [Rhodococcus jostii]SEE01173.1 Part of AAA domain-containing protein [Rhodococcus jostii]
MSSPETDAELAGRVQRLLQFLREIVRARTKPVLRVDQHEQVEWLHQDGRTIQLDPDAAQGDIVLRVPLIGVDDPPDLPTVLAGWVDASARADSSRADLELNASDAYAEDSDEEYDVRRAYDVRQAFDAYMPRWQAWAKADRERRPHADLYQSLQMMLQELNARPESIELVLASGLLILSGAGPDDGVQTHLVTQSASIHRDPRTGDLLVRLIAGSQPRLEDSQLFTGLDVYDSAHAMPLQKQLQDTAASPLSDGVRTLLTEWAPKSLMTPVTIRDGVRQPDADADGTLTLSPALVLRKRSAFALVEYYEQMISHLERDGATVPLGLAQLVEAIEPADRLAWLERTGAATSSTLAEDPLFPLPANAEQSQIIERLGGDSGVVVEGPPGTGKTHTIANLVSALLARGQRVLVTSEKAQALRVLRDKLPPEMQELCVSITDLSRGGSDELTRSVATIAERKSSFNPHSEGQKIADLRAQRDEAVQKRAVVLEQVKALRESETYHHDTVADGYEGTAATIVRKVMGLHDAYEWLPGPLLSEQPPLVGTEVETLRRLCVTASPDRAQRSRQTLPTLDSLLPNRAELERLCSRASTSIPIDTPQSAHLLEVLGGVDPETAYTVRRHCKELQARAHDVLDLDGQFQTLADTVLSGRATHLWGRLDALPAIVEAAAAADRYIGAHDVQCSVMTRPALQAVGAFAVAMESGAVEWKARFRRSEEQKAVEELGIDAVVDGVPATTAASVRLVTEHLRAHDAAKTAATLLADLRIPVDMNGSRAVQVDSLNMIVGRVARVRALLVARDALARELFALSPNAPRIRNLADATAVAGAAEAITTRADVDDARAALDTIVSAVSTEVDAGPSPEGTALVAALDQADNAALSDALTRYAIARVEQQDQRLFDELSERLSPVAPALYELVRRTAALTEWDEMSWQMSEAWAWRRARQWVTEQHRAGREQELEAELNAVDADLAHLTARLAAATAWRDCLEHLTADQVRALQTYREHISSIGAGAGKYAEKYRSAARSAMGEAQGAVPAWVMPLQQVLASIPPVPGSFDVVIVDEASQADITNLFLLWLAPRVIVVGDDKQCAPADIPTNGTLDDVFTRLDAYLPDLPEYVQATLTPRSSLFSILRTSFGQVVRLREHFRSMPEIINWSSTQFYGELPLVPVRQFGADRLPPLKHTYVSDAAVSGRDSSLTNHVEAAALVDQLIECLVDPRYDGKTFGIVVLQGQSQVDAIRTELVKRIGIEQWEQRRLRVGTPPDFQGDERSVVFLSMVVAPEQNFAPLTANQYKRRFNVAASRAQDQLWLFHSVTVDELKRADLRNSLLSYMMSTSPAPADPMPQDVDRDVRIPPFDSLLEQRVFNDIAERGYHVNSQVEVNNRRIDLVVTGGTMRLAVECDGDAFSTTPEQRIADLEREQELKRCGWTFWRVRESEYYLDPKTALSSLWDTLDNLGIAPHAVDHALAIEAAATERAARDAAAASERGKHAAPIGASRP